MTMSLAERMALLSPVAPFDAATISADDAALYIERMTGELGEIADRAGLGFLAYLLEVAREEARLQCPPTQPKVMHGELPPR